MKQVTKVTLEKYIEQKQKRFGLKIDHCSMLKERYAKEENNLKNYLNNYSNNLIAKAHQEICLQVHTDLGDILEYIRKSKGRGIN